MTQPPTIAQLHNLTDRAAHGLSNDEQQRLRDGIDALHAELAGVRTLRDRWIKAGPPPLGQSLSRWWDRRLAELGAALNPEQPGPG